MSLLFGSITSILYLFDLPTFRIVDENLSIYEIGRFGGLWGGANVFSHTMAILLLAFLICMPTSKIIKFIVYFIALFGWIASGSRSVALYFILFMPFAFVDFSKVNQSAKKYLSTIILALIGFVFIISTFGLLDDLVNLGGAITRIIEEKPGEDIRNNKNSYYLKFLFSNYKNILFGINPDDQTSSEVEFSDNGSLLFLLDNGIPFTILYFSTIILVFAEKRNFYFKQLSISMLLFFLIVFLTISMNNAVLWDHYVYLSVLVLFLIKNKNDTSYQI